MGWSITFHGQPTKAHFVAGNYGQPTQQRAKDASLRYYKDNKLAFVKDVNEFMAKIARTNNSIKLVEALEPASSPEAEQSPPMPPLPQGVSRAQMDEMFRRLSNDSFDWGEDDLEDEYNANT